MPSREHLIPVHKFFAMVSQFILSPITAFMLIMLYLSITDKEEIEPDIKYFVIFIFFVIFAFILYLHLKIFNYQVLLNRQKKYIELINVQEITSIENISTNLSRSVDKVKKDLEKLISKKFLPNITMDKKRNELIIQPSTNPHSTFDHSQTVDSTTISVKCNSCGAVNRKSINVSSNCEYCNCIL